MNKYNFDIIADRYNKNSVKYGNDTNVLPMWVADMDFEVLPEITDAIVSKAKEACYGYTELSNEFFEAYINFYKRHHNIDFKVEDCVFATGIVGAIDSIFKHLLNKGDKVIIQTPVYPVFANCIRNNGLVILENKLKYENGSYQIDYDNLEKIIKEEDPAALLLCNPHNPTGYIYSLDELNRIIKLCKENNVLLLSDEIHGEICSPNYKYHSILEASYYSKSVTLLSGGKVFNIAGIQSSCLVIKDKELRDAVQNAVYHDDIGEPNFFAEAVNVAAFNNGDEWIEELNAYIDNNKQYFYEFILKELPNLKVIRSNATYLLWVDVSGYTNDSDELIKDLINTVSLRLSSGKSFLGNGDTFVRINLATSLDNVKDGCLRLKKYFENKKVIK